MKIEKVFVSPDFAKSLLAKNNQNRRHTTAIVSRYAAAMSEGRWKENTAESIKISKSGQILDGQHRLMAVVKSGIGVNFHVATGLDDDIFDVIDTGKKRTGGDTLSVLGVKDYNVIAGAINLVFLAEEGLRYRRFTSNDETLERYRECPDFWAKCAKMSGSWSRRISGALSSGWIAAFFYLFNKIDEDDSIGFLDQLCTGENIKNKTILVLRKRLIDARVSKQYFMNPETKFALVVKTWNAFREGRELTILRYKPIEETFPVAK